MVINFVNIKETLSFCNLLLKIINMQKRDANIRRNFSTSGLNNYVLVAMVVRSIASYQIL